MFFVVFIVIINIQGNLLIKLVSTRDKSHKRDVR